VTSNGLDRRLASSSLVIPLLAVMVAAAPAPARAQSMLSDAQLLELKERAASEVWIYQDREAEQEPVHGFLTRLTDQELTVLVDRHEETLALDSIWRIERRGDTVWDGFAAGAFAGLLEWALIIRPEVHHHDAGAQFTTAVFSMGFWGVVGAGIDALAVGRTTIYDARIHQRRAGPSVAASADGRGAMLSWTVKF
jgi:hypothetical protein